MDKRCHMERKWGYTGIKKLANERVRSVFLLINARSLCNKIHALQIYSALYRPAFIAITESWANENILDSVFSFNGYNIF